MILLPTKTITTALAIAVVGNLIVPIKPVKSLVAQANFIYGSGGATAKAYLQTTLDGGATWIDIGFFSFTTSSGIDVINLSSLTPETTAIVPTDGTATANQDGIIGSQFRLKLVTTGTYAGGTSLRVDIFPNYG